MSGKKGIWILLAIYPKIKYVDYLYDHLLFIPYDEGGKKVTFTLHRFSYKGVCVLTPPKRIVIKKKYRESLDDPAEALRCSAVLIPRLRTHAHLALFGSNSSGFSWYRLLFSVASFSQYASILSKMENLLGRCILNSRSALRQTLNTVKACPFEVQ